MIMMIMISSDHDHHDHLRSLSIINHISYIHKCGTMGEVELDQQRKTITVRSHIITYGTAADEEVTARMRQEIESMWNEPQALIYLNFVHYQLRFQITSECKPSIDQLEVLQNTDPRNNFFRIEPFVHGNISFVDGLGCNSGYFLLENLYEGSTTAAHEYGHTMGLDHPRFVDIRGQGVPGIMYPRGTLVDPEYQYDPEKPAGVKGGTMYPIYRKVRPEDIELLKWEKLRFVKGKTILGEFTNIYHWPHDQFRQT
jgi:hypothetical protein